MDRLLEEFKLTHVKDSLGYSLSGGERRRIEIARTIANNPSFILLDEPFAGVDPIAVEDIQNIIDFLYNKCYNTMKNLEIISWIICIFNLWNI